MFGKLNAAEIEELLSSQIVARIGCHHDDVTYVVPISYAYDGNYIYCHSGEGMKSQMMRKNPRVCIQVDDMINMANWKSVVCWGDAEELHDEEDRIKALNSLLSRKLPLQSSETTHILPDWPFSSGGERDVPGILFRITVNEKTGRYERSSQHKSASS